AMGDRHATRANIDKQLQELLQGIGKRDTVLVALSGHGLQFKAPGRESEDAFYCPVDAVKGEPKTLFSLSYLIDEVLATKGGKNLVIVDACRDAPSDPTRGAGGVQGRRMELPEDTAVFFSCSAGQRSYESEKAGGGHGVFTHCLLEGLQGQAAQPNGDLTWSGLVRHV